MLNKNVHSGNRLTAKKTTVLAIAFLMIAAMILPAALAAIATQSPTKSTSTNNWENTDFAYADSGGYADTDNPTQNATYYGYGFAIPSGNSIDGIEVRLDAWQDGGAGQGYLAVELSNDGGVTWTAEKRVPDGS